MNGLNLKIFWITVLIVGSICLAYILYYNNGSVISISTNATKTVEDTSVKLNTSTNIHDLLTQSNASNLDPRSIENLDKVFGFRGLRLHTNLEEIDFNYNRKSNVYGTTFETKWETYDTGLGMIRYWIFFNYSPYTLADSEISSIFLKFADEKLAEILLSFNFYSQDEFTDPYELDQNKFDRLLSAIEGTFGAPTKHVHTSYDKLYHASEKQINPVEQALEVRQREWSSEKVKLILKNVLPDEFRVDNTIHVNGGDVQLIYRSKKYESKLKGIERGLDYRYKREIREENRRREIGEF